MYLLHPRLRVRRIRVVRARLANCRCGLLGFISERSLPWAMLRSSSVSSLAAFEPPRCWNVYLALSAIAFQFMRPPLDGEAGERGVPSAGAAPEETYCASSATPTRRLLRNDLGTPIAGRAAPPLSPRRQRGRRCRSGEFVGQNRTLRSDFAPGGHTLPPRSAPKRTGHLFPCGRAASPRNRPGADFRFAARLSDAPETRPCFPPSRSDPGAPTGLHHADRRTR